MPDKKDVPNILWVNQPLVITFAQAYNTSVVDLAGTKDPYSYANQKKISDVLDDNLHALKRVEKRLWKQSNFPLNMDEEIACALFAGVPCKMERFGGTTYVVRSINEVAVTVVDKSIQIVERLSTGMDNVIILRR